MKYVRVKILCRISAVIILAGLSVFQLAGCAASGAFVAPEITDAVPEPTAGIPEASTVPDVPAFVPDTTVVEAEETAEPEKTVPPPEKPSEGKLTGMISQYLNSEKPAESIPEIKECLARLEDLPGVAEKNPFFWYVKGLVGQYEGDNEAAAGFMEKAAGIAPNNRDIELWRIAFEQKDGEGNSRRIKAASVAPGLEDGSFDFSNGTLWVDEHTVLLSVQKEDGPETGQYLMQLDVDTMLSRQVYEGNRILLDSVTPDGKYAVLYDGGLKLVFLETGTTVALGEKASDAVLSPDGGKLAYCAEGLWIYDMETGGNIMLDDGKYDASPIWFPDGKSLLFIGGLEEKSDGTDRLRSIFRMPVDYADGKEPIDESWKEQFHGIKWILAGEILRAEVDGGNGLSSMAYYLYTGYKNQLGNADNGQYPVYRQDDAEYLYLADSKGGITLMDLDGIIRARFEYGNIWGSSFGIPVKGIEVLQVSEGVLLYYRTPFDDVVHVCAVDEEMENPRVIADIPADSPLRAAVNRTSSRALFAVGADELLLVEMNQPVI